MIDRHREGGALREEFKVLGSTGNVYTVTIDRLPECTCPDALKGNHCKHILFVFLKVLHVGEASGLWYQKALITSELEEIFAGAPLAPNAPVHLGAREAYARATGKNLTQEGSSKKRRVMEKGDDCPICYETMHGLGEGKLRFCDECGNALHGECFEQWSKSKRGESLTCVWCRAAVVQQQSKSAGGYLNLGGVVGLSPVRDTSSYYRSGWRRYAE